jgi:hypothetical protein
MEDTTCQVFVSCAVKDREKVRGVKAQLEKGGYATFWDEKASDGKELLHREAAQAIDCCSIFVCCLSQDYLESVLTMKEIRLAKFWGKSMVVIKVRSFAVSHIVAGFDFLIFIMIVLVNACKLLLSHSRVLAR